MRYAVSGVGVLLLAFAIIAGECTAPILPNWFRKKSPEFERTVSSRLERFLPETWKHLAPEESEDPSQFHALQAYFSGRVFRAAFKALTLQGAFDSIPGSLSYYRRHLYLMAGPIAKIIPLHKFELNELRLVVRSLWNCDGTSALRSIKMGVTKPRHKLFLVLARRRSMVWRNCAASGASTSVMVRNRLLFMGIDRNTIENLNESERTELCDIGFSCWQTPMGFVGDSAGFKEDVRERWGGNVVNALDRFMLLKTLQWGYGVPSKLMSGQSMESLRIAKNFFEAKARMSTRVDLNLHPPVAAGYSLPKLPEEKDAIADEHTEGDDHISGDAESGFDMAGSDDEHESTDFNQEDGIDRTAGSPGLGGPPIGSASIASLAGALAASIHIGVHIGALGAPGVASTPQQHQSDDPLDLVGVESFERSIYLGARDGEVVYDAVQKFRELANASSHLYSRSFATKLDQYLDKRLAKSVGCPRANTKPGKNASVGDLFKCIMSEMMPAVIQSLEAQEDERWTRRLSEDTNALRQRVILADIKTAIESCLFPDCHSRENWEGLPDSFMAQDGDLPGNYKRYSSACRYALDNLENAVDRSEERDPATQDIVNDILLLRAPADKFYNTILDIDSDVLEHGDRIMYLSHLLTKLSGRVDMPCEYSKNWVECALADIYMSSYFTALQVEKDVVKEIIRERDPDERTRLSNLVMSVSRETRDNWERCKDKLSTTERDSVTSYTQDGFKTWNPFLRSFGYPKDERFSIDSRIEMVSRAALVSSGLSKMPARSDLANGRVRVRFTNLTLKYQRDRLFEDGILTDMGFLSTSVAKGWEWRGNFKLLIEDVCSRASYKNGDRCLSTGRFLAVTGALVRSLSGHEGESEVLYLPGTQFSVKGEPLRIDDDGRQSRGSHSYEVELEEVIDIGI